jgi:hypothetical protein
MSALGHSRLRWSRPTLVLVRCYSNSGQTRVRLECPLCAKSGRGKAVARLRNNGLRQPGFAARRQSSLYPMPMA